jgi:hypothetical protein
MIFTICWIPYTLVRTFDDVFGIELMPGSKSPQSHLRSWLLILPHFNASINPVIYGLMWHPFRKAASAVSIKASFLSASESEKS